jgi:hypothetical protein
MEVMKSLMSRQKIDSAYDGESNENNCEDNDDSENMGMNRRRMKISILQ